MHAHHPSPGGEAEQSSPASLLMHAARAFRRRSIAALAPWDLSPHQARALRVVATHGPLRSASLAESLRIAPRSATEVVDALVQRGLVEREADPDDRRAVLVCLTTAGADLRDDLEQAREAAAQEFFGVLDDTEQESLAALLSTLLRD